MLSPTCSKCLLILAYFVSLILYRHEMEIGMKMTGEKKADHVTITVQINMLALIPWRNWNRTGDMSTIAKCRNQMGCFISGTPGKMAHTLVLPCFSLQLSCQCLGLGLGGHETCRGPAAVSTHNSAIPALSAEFHRPCRNHSGDRVLVDHLLAALGDKADHEAVKAGDHALHLKAVH